jgi:ABC-type lipoprotein export system ATPase subunit
MIHIENLSKVYKSPRGKVEALKNISFHVEKGEFIVIKGPSGSGKTTLLQSIGGMLQPTSGIIRVDGENIYSMKQNKRTGFRASYIGFVFQLYYLIPYVNVLENILLSAALAGNGKNQEKALELANSLRLIDRIRHYPSELSAGECQRVALARALIHEPRLLLADEPTGNLDIDNSIEVLNIIKQYHQQGGTVVLVTHSRIADSYSNLTFNLENGEIHE